MATDPVLVTVELRFTTDEDPQQLAERVRESVGLIVGRDRLEDFRVCLLYTTPSPRDTER
jgi:hypothetical protein